MIVAATVAEAEGRRMKAEVCREAEITAETQGAQSFE
jgi:hypothetical protein